MKMKSLLLKPSKPSSALLSSTLLSASLLVSACSNNEVETIAATDENAVTANNMSNDMNDDMNDNDAVTAEAESPSLVTNTTEAGTPEDTVKQALDSLYYGDAKDAVDYYQVDMEDFEQELANTQSAFQQTVESVTFIDTQYNEDKTRATIEGELMLRGQSEPAPLTYELQKIEGTWKILG